MKTPEEIKKGLRLFASELDDVVALCNVEEATGLLEEARNKMFEAANCIEEMDSDLNAWGDVASSPGAVEDMARENYRLETRLAQVERERDAAVRDCARFPCYTCTERTNGDYCPQCRTTGTFRTLHEWRGVCAENTKEV